jgi:hypothetical protein
MTRLHPFLPPAAVLVAVAAAACSDTTRDLSCDHGRCDEVGEREPVLIDLHLINHEVIDGEQETFRLVADVSGRALFEIPDGHVISARIWAADGASNPDFRVTGELVYDADHVGGYLSETIDSSELLPWQALRVRLIGELGDQLIDQTFEFSAGDERGREVEESVFGKVATPTVVIDGEAELLVVTAEPVDELLALIPEHHALNLEVFASDGASNPDFRIAGGFDFFEIGIEERVSGVWVSDVIETTELVPWQQLSIRIFGELRGRPIDETFRFGIEDIDR